MSGITILGMGVYTPDFIAENKDFTKFVETSDEWIVSMTGIKRRHISTGEPTWYMACEAAKAAIKNANLAPEEIDMIILTSVTPDYYSPSGACVVQGMIGATNAIAFDVNAACAGFVYAIDMARCYIDDHKNILVISSENLSKLTDYSDRSTCVLFGDAAAACVVTKSDGLFSSFLKSDGTGAGAIVARALSNDNVFTGTKSPQEFDKFADTNKHYLYMDGREVYKFATKVLPEAVEKACVKANVSVEDLKIIVPHQANVRIIETAAKNLKVPIDRFFVNIADYGNTSSASIPLALYEYEQSGQLKRGDKVCLVGFGAGLVAGAVVFEW